jgi:hypothetical protein
MAHDTGLPSTWVQVGEGLHANSLWILPLVALERGFDNHPVQAVIAVVVWGISAYAAVKYHVLRKLGRQRLLTWTFISVGAALLALGIYRLSADSKPGSAADATPAPQIVQGYTQAQLDEKIAAATASQASSDASQLQATKQQLDRMVAIYGSLDNTGRPLARNPYPAGPVLLQSKYTRQEASDLISAIGTVKIVIGDYRLLQTPDDILPLEPLGYRPRTVQGVAKIKADGIDATINTITTHRENLAKVGNQIQQAMSDQRYGADLGRIIGNSGISDMDSCLAVFMSALQTAKRYNAAPELLDGLLAPAGGQCLTARRNLRAWQGSIMGRLNEAEHNLRSYL